MYQKGDRVRLIAPYRRSMSRIEVFDYLIGHTGTVRQDEDPRFKEVKVDWDEHPRPAGAHFKIPQGAWVSLECIESAHAPVTEEELAEVYRSLGVEKEDGHD